MNADEKTPQDAPKQTIKIEDLPVEDGKDADVKGGPIYMPIEGIKGEVTPRRP